MNHMINAMRQTAGQVGEANAGTRVGVVTNYDPGSYSVKVKLQPDDILSGWIPMKALAVGDGFGIYAAPRIGDVVELHFQEDSIDCASAGLRFFGDAAKPVSVPAGEIWLVQKSGSAIKFHDSGDVELIAAGNLTATVAGNASATVGGNLSATVTGNATFAVSGNIVSSAALWTHTGAMQLIGALKVTASITDMSLVNTKTMGDMRTVYNTHTHVETGGTTTTPTPTI